LISSAWRWGHWAAPLVKQRAVYHNLDPIRVARRQVTAAGLSRGFDRRKISTPSTYLKGDLPHHGRWDSPCGPGWEPAEAKTCGQSFLTGLECSLKVLRSRPRLPELTLVPSWPLGD